MGLEGKVCPRPVCRALAVATSECCWPTKTKAPLTPVRVAGRSFEQPSRKLFTQRLFCNLDFWERLLRAT